MPSTLLAGTPRLTPAELQEITALFRRLACRVGDTPPSADVPAEGPLQGPLAGAGPPQGPFQGTPLQPQSTLGSQASFGPMRYPDAGHAEPALSLGLSKGGLSRHPTGEVWVVLCGGCCCCACVNALPATGVA